ncbi:ADP-ribosylation factor-like protein 3 [Tubulanus polymorphus]|uniref:ADP-ribosylation factor-like protein 3 n=1 Tax=Tubulanus polymorphus TaxID=672921 RepID=UPI003DA407F4
MAASSRFPAVIAGAGVLAATAAVVGGLSYWYLRRYAQDLDEGFDEENSRLEDTIESHVLVLGLSGAGKTAFIDSLTNSNRSSNRELRPTDGFNVISLQTPKGTINIKEIGGGKEQRKYWTKYIEDTDLLIYVVDAADEPRIGESKDVLHVLLNDERLQEVPTVILANKQDIPSAESAEQLRELLNLNIIPPKKHEIRVIASSIPPHGVQTVGVDETQRIIRQLCKK